MTIQAFIDFSFDKISDAFPTAEIKYQRKGFEETHFIQVLPQSIHSDPVFLDLFFELTELFDELETGEDLCIVGEDVLIELDKPEKVSHRTMEYVFDFDTVFRHRERFLDKANATTVFDSENLTLSKDGLNFDGVLDYWANVHEEHSFSEEISNQMVSKISFNTRDNTIAIVCDLNTVEVSDYSQIGIAS